MLKVRTLYPTSLGEILLAFKCGVELTVTVNAPRRPSLSVSLRDVSAGYTIAEISIEEPESKLPKPPRVPTIPTVPSA